MKAIPFCVLFFLPLFSAQAQTGTRVGVILPLTGVLAEYGNAAKNGIDMAKDARPELFANLEFLYEDSQWDAKTSVSAFNRLREGSRVALIFNWGNPTTEAVAPLSERYKLPVIGMTLDPSVAANRHYLIRSTNPASDFSKVLADYLKSKGYKRNGVVLAQNTYVQGLFNGLRNHLSADQTAEEAASHAISENDFRSTVARVKGGRYDALGVFLISGQVSSFYRQLRQQGVTIPTFGTDFFESTTEIEQAEGGMEGAVYTHLAVTPEFESAYIKRFNNDYQIAYAGNAHDMAVLIGTLFGNGAPADPEAVMKSLRAAPAIKGVTGEFRYRSTPEGDSFYEFPVALKVIQGGKIKVERLERVER